MMFEFLQQQIGQDKKKKERDHLFSVSNRSF